MSHSANASQFGFESDLARRVENFSLSSNVPSNSLVPVFEALYNSIHSIVDKHKDLNSGKISIIRLANDDIQVIDDGNGLTEENFLSFRTYDSPQKKKIFGKGIGRISWLKVFASVDIDSVFLDGDKKFRRKFSFVLNSQHPIQNHTISEVSALEPIFTTTTLRGLRETYRRHFPVKLQTFANRIISHFSAFFLSGVCPTFSLSDQDQTIDLRSHTVDRTKPLGKDIYEASGQNFTIRHYLVEKTLGDGKPKHQLQFTGATRTVTERDIGGAIGLTTFVDVDGKQYFYNGIVSSEFLDQHTNTERTGFDISTAALDDINKKAIGYSEQSLASQVERLIAKQLEIVDAVVKKFPRYSYLVGDRAEFVRNEIPRNMKTAEAVYSQLSVLDFRETRKIERTADAVSRATKDDVEAELGGELKKLIEKISSQEASALAEYTAKRKLILDILQRRLGYTPSGEMKRYSEEAVHALICPVRTTKTDIAADNHNLWIIDDKLTYYSFWASDKRIKEYVTKDSDARPDIALFSGRTLFMREGTNQPVVIVEFKKPARSNYDYEENPIVQIYDYIEEIKNGKIFDKDGAIIDDIGNDHPFFCYVIADFTNNLKKYLKATQINLPLPGGSGYYGFNPEYNAYIQVLNWKHIIADARLRNEAFFKELKI